MTAILSFLSQVFPVFLEFDPGRFFLKAILFGGLYLLNRAKPVRYLWSVAFVLLLAGIDLGFAGVGQRSGLAVFVSLYLSWMCAEVSFQSASVEEEERLPGWWVLPLLLIGFL